MCLESNKNNCLENVELKLELEIAESFYTSSARGQEFSKITANTRQNQRDFSISLLPDSNMKNTSIHLSNTYAIPCELTFSSEFFQHETKYSLLSSWVQGKTLKDLDNLLKSCRYK